MAGIISIIGGAFTGGGLSFLSKGIDLFDRHLRHRQDVTVKEMEYAHELVLLDRQSEMKLAEMETEREIALIDGQSAMRVASYEHDTSLGKPSQMLVNVLRLFRPFLTLTLLAVSVWAIYKVISSGVSDPAFIAAALDSLLYLTTLSVTWWYGDRAQEKHSARA